MPRDMVQVREGRTSRQLPGVTVSRSQFNRSHGRKMSFDASYLYPILVDEVLPGDTFTLKMHGFARIFSPLDAPVMDNIELDTAFFFVPCRLVWDNWEYFQGAHDAAGAQDTDYTVPVLASGVTVDHDNSGVALANMMAYYGIPHGLQTGQVNVNALPFRCYNLIWNEWYRDQNVRDPITVIVDNGPDATGTYTLRQGAKKHDYFTSCLPYLQKGDPVSVAFTEDARVYTPAGIGSNVEVYSTNTSAWQRLDSDLAQVDVSTSTGGGGNMYADLQNLTGITINALRQSVAIQRLLERDARGGTRYVEMIKHQFGVTSPDYRVQRPEYLGGGKSYINITPVANTADIGSISSASGVDQHQGKLHGIGHGVISGHGFAKSFTEHGYIIGLIRARGDVTYFQGLDRMYSRSTRYDFYMPVLANLGEQSVLNKELYISNSSATDDAVFGYQERWAEYRQKKSEIVGLFNPDVTGSLSHWHLAQDFGSLPTLNWSFIIDATPMDRIVSVTTEQDFIADLWFDYRCARPIPVYSIPSLTSGRF